MNKTKTTFQSSVDIIYPVNLHALLIGPQQIQTPIRFALPSQPYNNKRKQVTDASHPEQIKINLLQ